MGRGACVFTYSGRNHRNVTQTGLHTGARRSSCRGGQSLPLHFLSIYCLPFLSISPLFPYLPSLNFSPPFPPRPLHSALPSTLRSGPLNLARVSVSSPSGVRGRAPPPSRVRGRALAAITIQLSQKCHINTQACLFLSLKTCLVTTILVLFVQTKMS